MQGFVFSVLRVLFEILDSAQFGFGVSGVFWVFFGLVLFYSQSLYLFRR